MGIDPTQLNEVIAIAGDEQEVVPKSVLQNIGVWGCAG
jgi:hypothetical protein